MEDLSTPRFTSDVTPTVSVIIPMLNEEDNVSSTVDAVRRVLESVHVSFEIILVDDGSSDNTWYFICRECHTDSRSKGISLSRNFGQQNAFFSGMHYASGRVVITMDGDLQHPPELIPSMLDAWSRGYKVVDANRRFSSDVGAFKRLTSSLFLYVFSKLSGLPMVEGASDFRLLDRVVVDAVKEMKDASIFLRGITHWVGYPRTALTYEVGARRAGATKFTLKRMVRYALSSLLSFSSIPLRLGIWLGLSTSAFAFLEIGYIVIRTIQGQTVPGWASIMSIVSLMFGVMFILVGILGAYLASIFEMLKNRPRFLVNEVMNIAPIHQPADHAEF